MTNLFDLMRTAQGGAAFDNLSKAFGLSTEETQKAVAALVPAFAMGLQRSAARPEAMDALVRMMAGGAFAGAWADPKTAFSQRSRDTGADALTTMFGSPDYVKRVSEQAAALSGVAGEATGKMLPILASTLMDGMAMMGAQMNAAGGGAAKPRPEPAPPPPSGNPWEDMFASMMGAPPKPAPEPEPEPELPGDPQAAAEAAFDAWRKMIDAGREMQDAQIAMMRAMMEGVWGKR
ncbi:DUF937 domain-containing protein [Salinarimonas rosea]|uniref:DUF937 domain-containing protein n=1 Tax=Salinarimonas rosea TaxID=552063 RepID=UPI0004205BF6|nr:DUF937 domain-containing protein [Salinarimonas rosea]